MRTVHVGADRLERWVAGFGERHPGAGGRWTATAVELSAPDGSSAVLRAAFPPLRAPAAEGCGPPELAAALVANGREAAVLRALLIRRGGYACAVVAQDAVTASKVGSRYVQGRTAAGGWSQQRFARRRDGQVHQLIVAATDVAARLLLPAGSLDALVTGGDRPLIERVLADPRLGALRELRRGPHLEIGDPRADLVRALPERARAIRIDLDER